MPEQDAITLLKADHAAVKKLFAQEHVKDEETEMFPDAKKFLGEKRLMVFPVSTSWTVRGD